MPYLNTFLPPLQALFLLFPLFCRNRLITPPYIGYYCQKWQNRRMELPFSVQKSGTEKPVPLLYLIQFSMEGEPIRRSYRMSKRAICAREIACVGYQTHSSSAINPFSHAQRTAFIPLSDTFGA